MQGNFYHNIHNLFLIDYKTLFHGYTSFKKSSKSSGENSNSLATFFKYIFSARLIFPSNLETVLN